jgi:predicted RNA-binding Zn ribbon-like protein
MLLKGIDQPCARMFAPFQLIAGHLALDFANTLDYRYDAKRRVDLLPSYEQFLEFAVQAAIISRAERKRIQRNTTSRVAARSCNQVREFREAIYQLFLSALRGRRPAAASLCTYNKFAVELNIPAVLAWKNAGIVRATRDLTVHPLAPVQPIIESATVLLTGPASRQLRECSDVSCRWLFLDTSKNHSRKWCSMQICGARDKSRRYYQRSKSSAV